MIRLNFDGACTPVNPGGVGTWGWVIDFGDQTPKMKALGWCDNGNPSTNNIAEYHGLLEGLRYLVERFNGRKDLEILIMGDSALVCNMVNRIWGKKRPHKDAPHLLPLLQEIWKLLGYLKGYGNIVMLHWIPREANTEADELTKLAYKNYLCVK